MACRGPVLGVIGLLLLGAAVAGPIVAPVCAQTDVWPPLPKQEFVAGRAAARADIVAGRAAFVAESGGVAVGKPLKITVPQYAYHKEEGGKRTPVIIIQAEEAQGLKLVGVRLANGKSVILPLHSVQLLGKTPPAK
jgi:hypothetical protein